MRIYVPINGHIRVRPQPLDAIIPPKMPRNYCVLYSHRLGRAKGRSEAGLQGKGSRLYGMLSMQRMNLWLFGSLSKLDGDGS